MVTLKINFDYVCTSDTYETEAKAIKPRKAKFEANITSEQVQPEKTMVWLMVDSGKVMQEMTVEELEKLLSGPILGKKDHLAVVRSLVHAKQLLDGKIQPQNYRLILLGKSKTVEGREPLRMQDGEEVRCALLAATAVGREEWAGTEATWARTDGVSLFLVKDKSHGSGGCLHVLLSDILNVVECISTDGFTNEILSCLKKKS